MRKKISQRLFSIVLGLVAAHGLITLTSSSSRASSTDEVVVRGSCVRHEGDICSYNGSYALNWRYEEATEAQSINPNN
jgi:hypothetical protein